VALFYGFCRREGGIAGLFHRRSRRAGRCRDRSARTAGARLKPCAGPLGNRLAYSLFISILNHHKPAEKLLANLQNRRIFMREPIPVHYVRHTAKEIEMAMQKKPAKKAAAPKQAPKKAAPKKRK
jgi:hypothetical protein